MRLFPMQPLTAWKPWTAVLVLALCSGCATSKAPVDSQKEANSEPSFIKKAAAMISPRPKAPPLLPHQKDLKFARHQYNLQKYDAAEFYLKKTLLQIGDEPSALKILPWTYFFQKQYGKALLAFERNHTIHPRDPDPLAGMGWCYLSLNNYPQALSTFSKAEKLSPSRFYDIQKGLAIIYLIQKNHEKALPFLQRIYHPQEIESLLGFWKSTVEQKPDVSLPILPESPNDPSLFTLPVEHPRYPSILWTLEQPNDEGLEEAWRFYRKKLYRKALQAFQNLPDFLAQSLDAKNGLAWSYLKSKQIRKAEEVFRKLSQTHPNFIGVVKGFQESEDIKMQKAAFAQYYLDLEKGRIAGKKFEALMEEYPDWAYPYAQLGMLELKSGNLEAANDHFQKSLELDPENEGGLKGLEELEKIRDPELYEANQAFKRGDYKEAASLFFYYIDSQKQQVPLTESLARAYNGLGWSLFHKGQYQTAIEKFKLSWKHRDFRSDAIKGIGFSNFHFKKYKNAIFYLKMAHDAFPEEKQISHHLDWSIMRSWDDVRARRYFEWELKKDPLRPSLYIGLGWVHFKQNKPDIAVEYFLKSISLDPDSVFSEEFFHFLEGQRFGWQVYNRLGWAYYHQRNYKKSSEMFQISIREQPYKSEAHKGMGYNFYQMKNYSSAIEYLKQALAINHKPDPVFEAIINESGKISFKTQTTVRSKLARAYFHSGDYAEAIRYYQEGLAIHPNQPDAYDGLGWVYLQLRRLTESRAAFTKAVKLEPLNSLSHKGLREVKQLLATGNIRIKKPAFPRKTMKNAPVKG